MIPAVPDMAEDVMRLDQLLHGRAAWTADLTAGEIRRPDSCWLAACVGDQLVGIVGGRLGAASFPSVAARWREPRRRQTYDAHLLLLLVHSEWWGQGIARTLLGTFAARTGEQLEASPQNLCMRIDVPVDADRARRLYAGLGASEVGRIADCDGFGRPAITLAWIPRPPSCTSGRDLNGESKASEPERALVVRVAGVDLGEVSVRGNDD